MKRSAFVALLASVPFIGGALAKVKPVPSSFKFLPAQLALLNAEPVAIVGSAPFELVRIHGEVTPCTTCGSRNYNGFTVRLGAPTLVTCAGCTQLAAISIPEQALA